MIACKYPRLLTLTHLEARDETGRSAIALAEAAGQRLDELVAVLQSTRKESLAFLPSSSNTVELGTVSRMDTVSARWMQQLATFPFLSRAFNEATASSLIATSTFSLHQHDDQGRSLLIQACEQGCAAIVQKILQLPYHASATFSPCTPFDVHDQDNFNRSALDYAFTHSYQRGNSACFQLFSLQDRIRYLLLARHSPDASFALHADQALSALLQSDSERNRLLDQV